MKCLRVGVKFQVGINVDPPTRSLRSICAPDYIDPDNHPNKKENHQATQRNKITRKSV